MVSCVTAQWLQQVTRSFAIRPRVLNYKKKQCWISYLKFSKDQKINKNLTLHQRDYYIQMHTAKSAGDSLKGTSIHNLVWINRKHKIFPFMYLRFGFQKSAEFHRKKIFKKCNYKSQNIVPVNFILQIQGQIEKYFDEEIM